MMQAMFPEARHTLKEADPEVFQLVQDEKKRQWYDTTCGIQNFIFRFCFDFFVRCFFSASALCQELANALFAEAGELFSEVEMETTDTHVTRP
jgi:hypothetical protein